VSWSRPRFSGPRGFSGSGAVRAPPRPRLASKRGWGGRGRWGLGGSTAAQKVSPPWSVAQVGRRRGSFRNSSRTAAAKPSADRGSGGGRDGPPRDASPSNLKWRTSRSGSSVVIWCMSSFSDVDANGGRPDASSYKTQPRLQKSDPKLWTPSLTKSSGAM